MNLGKHSKNEMKLSNKFSVYEIDKCFPGKFKTLTVQNPTNYKPIRNNQNGDQIRIWYNMGKVSYVRKGK